MLNKKIGIIASSLTDEKTGVGGYLWNVLGHIVKNNKNNIYHLDIIDKCNYSSPNLIVEKRTKIVLFGKEYFLINLFLAITYPLRLKKNKYHLVFNPSAVSTFFKFSIPNIVTAFDLTPILFPETHTSKTYFVYKFFLPRTLKNADKIIAISQNTKDDLIKHFNIPEEKIRVIYLAANKSYKLLPNEEINKIKIKYNLNYSFILYVGTLEPRKNIVRLIEAFYKARNENSINHKLVFTGRKGWKYENIFNKIKELNLEKDIIFTGYVSDEDLPALYNTADLFVYPSIYEGFGLPPLEAMACGTPVITSNVSSLPEVVGNAGIMVNPYNVNELADKITEVLTNEELKKELSQKGLERAKLFSWEKCAKETMEVFEEAINCEK